MSNKLFFYLMVAVVAAIGVLLFSIPSHAASALVLFCDRDSKVCELKTARIYFSVPLESVLPAECLTAGQRKVAEVADLLHRDEAVRVVCNGR